MELIEVMYRRALAAEQKLAEAVEVVREYVRLQSGAQQDILSAHQNRGGGASGWMREDDADFRKEFREAGVKAAAFLSSVGEATVLASLNEGGQDSSLADIARPGPVARPETDAAEVGKGGGV